MKQLVQALALCGLLGGSEALAISIDLGSSTLNGNSVIDHSAAGLLSFDPSFANDLGMTLVLTTEAGDYTSLSCLPAVCLDWNGFFTNLSGSAWQSFRLTVSMPVRIETLGDVTPEFGSVNSVTLLDAQTALIGFDDPPGEISGFELGGLDLGTSNWRLDLAGLLPTQAFTLTLVPTSVVPVPAAVWLFGSGLGLLGLLRRQRVRKQTVRRRNFAA